MTTDNLMPKATAKWLIRNTSMTFEQIAHFCNLHILEVHGLDEGDVGAKIKEMDPIMGCTITREEIDKCQEDPSRIPQHIKFTDIKKTKSVKKYVPLAKKRDKPDAIGWVIKNLPEFRLRKLIKLFGTTKTMVENVKHKMQNTNEIIPRHPVGLGFCTDEELEDLSQD